MHDPEKTFLTSKEYLAAREGAHAGFRLKGLTTDDDTAGTVAMAVLSCWIDAGGLEEAALLEMAAMLASVAQKLRAQAEDATKH